MKIKNIKIGKSVYEIKEKRKIKVNLFGLFGFSKIQGRINYAKGTIDILKSLSSEEKKSVLYHEVSHGILYELQKKYRFINRNDEEQTDDLKDILLNLFKIKNNERGSGTR